MDKLLYGLITGMIFGFLAQRARVVRYDKQLGALLLEDMTIVKFMLSAVMTGVLGLYLCQDLGIISLSLKPTVLGGNILGGLIFGIGWALAGYCPGTALGALGEGRWDSLWAVLGMLGGAAIFAELYPSLKASVLTWGDFGKIALPQALGLNHWLVIACYIVLGIGLLYWFEKKEL